MAQNLAFNVGVGLVLDPGTVVQQAKDIAAGISKSPILLKTQFQSVDTSQAGAEKILGEIQKQASSIQDITTKADVFAKQGEANIQAVTQMTVKWVDQLGNAYTEVIGIKDATAQLDNTWQKIGTVSGKMPIGAIAKEAALQYKAAAKEIEGMSKSATDWLAKSQNMSGQTVRDAQQTAQAIVTEAAAFKELQRNVATGAATGQQLTAAQERIRALSKTFDEQVAATQRASGSIRSFGETLMNSIKQTVAYSLSIGAVRNAIQRLQEGIQFVSELNKEMTKIQVLGIGGANTTEEINSLAQAYTDLARQMGLTTMQVAEGSVEWLRQGKTIQETTELLKSTAMLAQLGNLDTAQSTEYLTAITNAYNISVKDTTSVVDKLIGIDNVAATSAGELATALRYTSMTAQQAGVSLDQVTSYIAAVSSTTRASAESIGQAFKTMFARMQDIKAGKIDEEGIGINNVESALARVNVKLRDSSGHFRELGTVLEELAGKWQTVDTLEQNNIAKAVAGIRQRETFLVLMNNMNDALRYQKVESESAGKSVERYGIYLNSVEASMNKAKAAGEALWQKTLTSDSIKIFYDATAWVLDLVSALGGLNTILAITAVILASIKMDSLVGGLTTVKALVGWLQVAGPSLSGIKAALTLSGIVLDPWLLLGVAVVGLGAGLYYLSQQAERNKKAMEDLATAAKNSSTAYKDLGDDINTSAKLWEEYDKLKNTIGKTAEEAQKFKDIQNQLNELAPGQISGHYDKELNFVIDINDNRQQSINLLKEELELKKQIALKDAELAALAAAQVYQDNLNKIKNAKDVLNQGNGPAGMGGNQGGDWLTGKFPDLAESRAKLDKLLLENKQLEMNILNTYKMLGTEAGQSFLEGIKSKAPDIYKNIQETLADQAEQEQFLRRLGTTQNGAKELVVKVKIDDAEFMQKLQGLQSLAEKVGTAITDAMEGKNIADNTALLTENGIQWEMIDGVVKVLPGEFEKFIERIKAGVAATYDLNAAQAQNLQSINLLGEEAQKALDKLINMQVDVIKQQLNAQKDALQQTLSNIQAEYNARKQALRDELNAEKQRLQQRQNALRDELQGILDVIDAQKDLLTEKKREADFNDEVAEKSKGIADLQQQIAQLQFDNSAEGIAKRKQLEAELAAKKKDLAKTEADRTYELQMKALDDLAKAQQKIYDGKIKSVQDTIDQVEREYQIKLAAIEKEQAAKEAALRAEIAAIDAQLRESGALQQQAADDVKNNWEATYQALIEWNRLYGDGVDATILKLAEQAQMALTAAQAMALAQQYNGSDPTQPVFRNGHWYTPGGVLIHHSGIESGNAGGKKNDEVLSMLTKDEIIFKPEQLRNMIANLIGAGRAPGFSTLGRGDVKVDMPITVMGNLDKAVMPDLDRLVEKVVVKLNDITKSRGNLRTTTLTSV